MKRRTMRPVLAFAASTLSLCLAAAVQADDLKLDWPTTTTDQNATGPSPAAPDSSSDLEERVKQLDAAAKQGSGNISLGVSGAVSAQVTHVEK
jgi:hypothetical protein